MAKWTTMSIYGYGESQMMGPDKNGKAANDILSTIEPLIAYLASLQQQGTEISMETLFTLNIYSETFIDFWPLATANTKPQRFQLADIDMATVNAFADQLAENIPEGEDDMMQMINRMQTIAM